MSPDVMNDDECPFGPSPPLPPRKPTGHRCAHCIEAADILFTDEPPLWLCYPCAYSEANW